MLTKYQFQKKPYGTNKSIEYFNGYNDDDVIRPLCIKLTQMIGYVKRFDRNKIIFFKATDKKQLISHTKILEKVSNLMDIKIDSEPIYDDHDKHIKAKTKKKRDKLNTNFQNKNVPKENPSYKCFSLIGLDSVIKVRKKYYPQTSLEE